MTKIFETPQDAWDEIENVRLALDEALDSKYGRTRDPRVCMAAHELSIDGGCERVDCALCDALSMIRGMIG